MCVCVCVVFFRGNCKGRKRESWVGSLEEPNYVTDAWATEPSTTVLVLQTPWGSKPLACLVLPKSTPAGPSSLLWWPGIPVCPGPPWSQHWKSWVSRNPLVSDKQDGWPLHPGSARPCHPVPRPQPLPGRQHCHPPGGLCCSWPPTQHGERGIKKTISVFDSGLKYKWKLFFLFSFASCWKGGGYL